jgi:hypothetical protein
MMLSGGRRSEWKPVEKVSNIEGEIMKSYSPVGFDISGSFDASLSGKDQRDATFDIPGS